MSDMLEQAIIDAAALKEAATKNAETLVLEKYSSQIKDAVETLLEQDDPAAGMMGDDTAEEEKSSVLEHIPLAVTSEDNEEIEIPLDKLTEELKLLNNSFYNEDAEDLTESAMLELDESNLLDILEEEDLEEDKDVDEKHCMEDKDVDEKHCMEEGEGVDEDGCTPAHRAANKKKAKKKKDRKDENLDEEIDLDEDIVEAIAEQLTVDLPGPTKTGWAGMPEKLIQLAEEELLAIEQDSKVKEEKAAMRKAVAKLQAANESLDRKNNKLQETLKKASSQLLKSKEVIMTLQNKLEESNLTNAKLLYQNKAMTSDSLNERQKEKLVEAVSNAETIEEAKMIFETLQNTVGSTSRKSQPKSLSEAVQKTSSVILSARRNSTQQEKSNPTIDRWKFLAGIDK